MGQRSWLCAVLWSWWEYCSFVSLVPEWMFFCVLCSVIVPGARELLQCSEYLLASSSLQLLLLQLSLPYSCKGQWQPQPVWTWHICCPLQERWGPLSPCFLAPALLLSVYLFRQDTADAGHCTCALNGRPGPQRLISMQNSIIWLSNPWGTSLKIR